MDPSVHSGTNKRLGSMFLTGVSFNLGSRLIGIFPQTAAHPHPHQPWEFFLAMLEIFG